MPFYNLRELSVYKLGPGYSTARGPFLHGEHLEVALGHMKAGEGSTVHSHEHEQMIYVLEGRLRFRVGDEEQEVVPGQLVHIPSGTPHQARALEDTRFISCKNLVSGKGSPVQPE